MPMPRIVSPKAQAEEPSSDLVVPQERPNAQAAIDAKLDAIVEILHRLDKRDRMRTMLSTFKTILTLIPVIVFLASAAYLYFYGEDLIQQITEMAGQRAAEYSEGSMTNFLEQFNNYLPKR